MTNLWGFLLQTLAVVLTGLILLAVKALLQDKLTPRWQYFVWLVLAVRIVVPVRADGSYVLLPVPVWMEMGKTLVEGGLASAYTAFYEAVHVASPVPWLTGRPVSVTDWIFFVYVLGVLAFLAWYLVSYLRLRHLLRRGGPAPAELQGQIRRVGERYGLKPCPAVVLPGLPSPMVCGVFRPVLALPAGVPVDGHVLLHEFLHVKYQDALQNVFWCLCRALHWCNPLVHLLLNRVGNDLESLCDQRVLERLEGEARRSYGVSLLNMANDRYSRAPGTTCVSNGGKNIARRIEAIVRFKTYPKGMALASLCVTVLLLCACLMGTVKPELTDASVSHALALEEQIATGRLTHCTTAAGALDTYVKGRTAGNTLYLMVASPGEQRRQLEDQMRRTGQVYDRNLSFPEEELLVYTLGDNWMIDGPGVRQTLSYGLRGGDYEVCHLQENGDDSLSALLVCRIYVDSGELAGQQGVVTEPVRIYQEEGYVVAPAGEATLYVQPWSLESSFEPSYGALFLPPAKVYYAQGESGEVTAKVHTIQQVEGAASSVTPLTSAVFTQPDSTVTTEYRFGGSEGEKAQLSSVGFQMVKVREGERAPDFSDVEEQIAEVAAEGTDANGSSTAGSFWIIQKVLPDWDGTVQNESGMVCEAGGASDSFVVRIFWNGAEREALPLKEVPVNGS